MTFDTIEEYSARNATIINEITRLFETVKTRSINYFKTYIEKKIRILLEKSTCKFIKTFRITIFGLKLRIVNLLF